MRRTKQVRVRYRKTRWRDTLFYFFLVHLDVLPFDTQQPDWVQRIAASMGYKNVVVEQVDASDKFGGYVSFDLICPIREGSWDRYEWPKGSYLSNKPPLGTGRIPEFRERLGVA